MITHISLLTPLLLLMLCMNFTSIHEVALLCEPIDSIVFVLGSFALVSLNNANYSDT